MVYKQGKVDSTWEGQFDSSRCRLGWVFMAQRVDWKGDIGTCYRDSDGFCLFPDLEFDLTNVSIQRGNED